MSYESIIVENVNAVCTITLNQPQKLNALSSQMLNELTQAFDEIAYDDTTRCVVITGAGRGFSAGADLTEPGMVPSTGELPDLGQSLEQRYNPLLARIRELPMPVVAVVNGTAAGAGCNIALACDFIFAADSAKFIQAFIKIGLVPDAGGTWTIPRLIGRARALRWMMTGEAIDAARAEQWGLITAVYPAAELRDKAAEWAKQLAEAPTAALGHIKTLVDAAEVSTLEQQLQAEADVQRICGHGHDFLEGVSAFIQKRPAKFTGK